MVKTFLIIGAGSFIGGILRFLVQFFVSKSVVSSFPLGTFIVNAVGCLLIGILYGISEKGEYLSTELRLFLAVGLCGGFTTFSAFALENIMLLKENNFHHFWLYTFLSVVSGFLFVYLGNIIVRAF